VYKNILVGMAKAHLSTVVEHGFALSMSFLSTIRDGDGTSSSSSNLALDYAITMTQIVHHLIGSSLTSLIVVDNEEHTTTSATIAASIDQVFTLVYEKLPILLTHTRTMRMKGGVGGESSSSSSLEKTESLLTELLDLITQTQLRHPIAFARFLSPFLHLFYNDLSHAVSNGTAASSSDDTPFFILEMSFLANVISCSDYTPEVTTNVAIQTIQSETQMEHGRRAITSKGDTSINITDVQNVVHTVWGVFFHHERISTLLDIALFFMTLTADHQSDWHTDPESYYVARLNSVADEDVLACAQNLYLALMEGPQVCQDIVVTKVTAILQDAEGQISAAKMEAGQQAIVDRSSMTSHVVRQWDTIYTAVGLSLGIIENRSQFNLKAWLECVVSCLRIIIGGTIANGTILPLLRHRIVWLLGCSYQYIGNRKITAELLVSVLTNVPDTQNDTVVQLAASQALNNILCDPDDSLICFLRQPDHIISSLYALTICCEDIESQSQTLSSISLLLSCIVGTGNTIGSSTAEAIVFPLSQIWEATQVQNIMLRRDVLSILSSVATAIEKEQFGGIIQIALPLLHNVLDPATREENLFLIETALILWLTLLRLAGSYDSNLGILFGRVKELLAQDLEHVKSLMNITQGYILLGGTTFLSHHSSDLQQILILLVGNVNPRGAAYLNLIFECLLGAFPSQGVPLFIHGGIANKMIQSCAANYNDENDCEPDRVIIIYLSVLARLVLHSSNILDTILPISCKQTMFGHDHLLSLYFRFFEESGGGSSLCQKLWTAFLLSLLPPSPTLNNFRVHLLELMDSLMSCCLDTIKQNNTALIPYSVGYDSEEETVDFSKSSYQNLLDANLRMDTIYNADIRSLLKLKMQQLSSDLNKSDHDRLLQSVRPNVLYELEQIIDQ